MRESANENTRHLRKRDRDRLESLQIPYFLTTYAGFFALALVLLLTGETGVSDRMGGMGYGGGAGVGNYWGGRMVGD